MKVRPQIQDQAMRSLQIQHPSVGTLQGGVDFAKVLLVGLDLCIFAEELCTRDILELPLHGSLVNPVIVAAELIKGNMGEGLLVSEMHPQHR